MKKVFTIQALLLLAVPYCFAQKNTGNTYRSSVVADSASGIIMYNSLIGVLGGDSIRYNAQQQPMQGLVTDFYEDGQVLHKGTYSNGKLVSFTNYFPSGKKERMFVQPSFSRASLKVYYDNSRLRTEVEYKNGNAIKWIDYYPSGNVEFYEEYSPDMVHLVARKSYLQNSFPENELVMVNKKIKKYEQKEFYKDGRIRTWGELLFFASDNDIRRDGTWRTFDPEGKLVQEEIYVHGELTVSRDSVALGNMLLVNTSGKKRNVFSGSSHKEKSVTGSNNKTSVQPPPGPTLPDEFVFADKDRDGKITAIEVSSAIDQYFDDESGKLTAQGISKLIDFYFDQ